jgi:hypothetical protein
VNVGAVSRKVKVFADIHLYELFFLCWCGNSLLKFVQIFYIHPVKGGFVYFRITCFFKLTINNRTSKIMGEVFALTCLEVIDTI